MSASRTGLPKYTTSANEAGCAYAAKIQEIVPFDKAGAPRGAKTLTFSDSPKRVNLIPEWIASNLPVVGGYFVVEDYQGNTICRFVDASTFASQFKPEQQP